MAKKVKSKISKVKAGKGTTWASLPWSKVHVNSSSAAAHASKGDDTEFLSSSNHYDNPDKADPSDLYDISNTKGPDYMEGANDPGIFLGLEVIDGSQYALEKIPVVNPVTQKPTGGFVTKLRMVQHVDPIPQKPHLPEGEEQRTSKKKQGPREEGCGGCGTESMDPSLDCDPNNKKKKKRKLSQDSLQDGESNSNEDGERMEGVLQPVISNETKKKKKTTKKKLKPSDGLATDKDREQESSKMIIPSVTQEQINSIRMSWSIATGGVDLHPKLCRSLYTLGFSSPTPIQSSTLAASILGKRDIVGAAPTGSGKTLSYLLPILNELLTEEEQVDNAPIAKYPLRALILCPTRELAMQVSMEFSKLINNAAVDQSSSTRSLIKCGTIVGGLSDHKQKRVLDVKRPPVLVATPGRLWDLMSSGEHVHLEYLKKLQFLVVDEADRMISQGSFPQLERIFEKIQRANPSLQDHVTHSEEDDESDSDDDDRLRSLPGVRGEAKVQMLDDKILEMIERQKGGMDSNNIDEENRSNNMSLPQQKTGIPQPMEITDEEYESQLRNLTVDLEDFDGDLRKNEEDTTKRQTFIFSATLTLPSCNQTLKSEQVQQSKSQRKAKQTVDGAIAEILEKIGAQGMTKIVDLSSSGSLIHNTKLQTDNRQRNQPVVKLPTGLSLFEICCTQKHKDSHLYAFLTTTKQGISGPCLVFCNSIHAVKRVGETLKVLKLPVKMLHAQMQQKARLQALESLKSSNSRAIVVATDVAARGLDIPAVASVVHYDVARAIDTFVHRAGRTARGVGEKAVGCSVSLVSASEEKHHQLICRAVKGEGHTSFDVAAVDSRLLANAQERVNLASKIVACENAESRTRKTNRWFVDAARDAGLELDEDLLDDGQSGGSNKERQQYLEAKKAKHELNILLAKPMRKQNYGKFLSNAGVRDTIQTENDVKPHIAINATNKKPKSMKNRKARAR